MESVYNTNLYSVLEFISIETAEDNYRAELQEQAHNEQIKKQKRR